MMFGVTFFAGVSVRGVTQDLSSGADSTRSAGAAAISIAVLETLPSIQLLGDMGAVTEVGRLPRRDGTMGTMPITAALALNDLRLYTLALLSLYPPSRDDYPVDSLNHVQRVRAAAWVERLRPLRIYNDPGVTGYQLVPFAEVAARAGDDTLARTLFDARIAALASSSSEQAYVLREAVNTFVDQTTDPARTLRNLVIAEHYAAQLRTLLMARFAASSRTKNDSTAVLYDSFAAEDTLMFAYHAAGVSAPVFAHGDQVLALAPRALPEERAQMLSRLQVRLASAVVATYPNPDDFQRRLDSISGRVAPVARPFPRTWLPAESSEHRMSRIADIVRNLREEMKAVTAQFALVGTVVPPVAAHVWLNTPDSTYRHTPRSRDFADGIVRVILVSDLNDPHLEALPILNRVEHWFPHRVEAVLLSETTGNIGPDISEPADEAAWLERYYVGVRHYTMPIALWVGEKEPHTVMMTDGHAASPAPSPVDTSTYRKTFAPFMIVDGHGILRETMDVRSRADEVVLRHKVQRLLQESQPQPRQQVPQ